VWTWVPSSSDSDGIMRKRPIRYPARGAFRRVLFECLAILEDRFASHLPSDAWLSPDGFPVNRFSTLISSSRSSQWMPAPRPTNRQRLRSAVDACDKRGYHASGTETLRPSLRSTESVSSDIVTFFNRGDFNFLRQSTYPRPSEDRSIRRANLRYLAMRRFESALTFHLLNKTQTTKPQSLSTSDPRTPSCQIYAQLMMVAWIRRTSNKRFGWSACLQCQHSSNCRPYQNGRKFCVERASPIRKTQLSVPTMIWTTTTNMIPK
jgi:hypothetical protein